VTVGLLAQVRRMTA